MKSGVHGDFFSSSFDACVCKMWLKEKRGVLEHLCRWMQAALSSHGADPQAVSAYMQAGT